MAETPHSTSRNQDRNSHIGIRLQYRANEKWERFEALGWTEGGFNFYNAQEIDGPALELKRGLTRFAGTIVWRSRNTSDDVLLATVVNELIFKRAKEVVDNASLHARLIKLIRVPGMVEEKRKILASLGASVADEKLLELITLRRLEGPMFHYGVRVQSEAWGAVVKSALDVSSVLVSLDKWSDGLAKK